MDSPDPFRKFLQHFCFSSLDFYLDIGWDGMPPGPRHITVTVRGKGRRDECCPDRLNFSSRQQPSFTILQPQLFWFPTLGSPTLGFLKAAADPPRAALHTTAQKGEAIHQNELLAAAPFDALMG